MNKHKVKFPKSRTPIQRKPGDIFFWSGYIPVELITRFYDHSWYCKILVNYTTTATHPQITYQEGSTRLIRNDKLYPYQHPKSVLKIGEYKICLQSQNGIKK